MPLQIHKIALARNLGVVILDRGRFFEHETIEAPGWIECGRGE
jgi:hypothetical protein